MNMNDYYAIFVRTHTQRDGEDRPFNTQLLQGALGCASEGGEIAGLVKKIMFEGLEGHPREEWENLLLKEVGDNDFYLQEIINAMGWTAEQVKQANIDKITARYPKGHFDAADSLAKADERVGLS